MEKLKNISFWIIWIIIFILVIWCGYLKCKNTSLSIIEIFSIWGWVLGIWGIIFILIGGIVYLIGWFWYKYKKQQQTISKKEIAVIILIGLIIVVISFPHIDNFTQRYKEEKKLMKELENSNFENQTERFRPVKRRPWGQTSKAEFRKLIRGGRIGKDRVTP